MRRWNGWGEETVNYGVTEGARVFLAERIGPGHVPQDVSPEDMRALVPPSCLKEHPLIRTDIWERVLHSTGQSQADWINIRGGRVPAFPDGVAYPRNGGEVREILTFARQAGAVVIPYGGGTSVVGHLTVPLLERPVLTVDVSGMNALLDLDERSRLATFQAGVRGPDLEAALSKRGYTLGHYPQSFEYSTLGGWVAARSAGQYSFHYGKIERLLAGGVLETPRGTLILPAVPASAAGPDLREMALGSEGRLGIMTEAVVRVSPLPEKEVIKAAFFPDANMAYAAVRELAQSGLPLGMLRLSLPEETETTLRLSDPSRALAALEKWLKWRGAGEDKCLLLYGGIGRERTVNFALNEAWSIIKKHHGQGVGTAIGKAWRNNRFRLPYIRNDLWEMGYAADTLETAVNWLKVPATVEKIQASLREALRQENEKVHVFTHLSHFYAQGASIYTSYVFRLALLPEENIARWLRLKRAASEAIVQAGGTISHQHGVGLDHLPYLSAEKGTRGMEMIRSVCRAVDPEVMMNPGKLFVDGL
ncbi:putative FAD-linked oxidoreductase [Peptococcaceae bacterium CEB3]|nr:putative FAD-linked oxidoreductase [Peptococcaceae bacterium CEB3]